MHTLFLMRHADPANTPPGGTDADRPLTPLGRRQAEQVGERLALRGVGLALCSSALRTRQTFEATGLGCPVETMEALYHGGVETMRGRIAETGEEIETLLVVGHAPTVPALASRLSTASAPDRSGQIASWYPPATVTEIAIDGPWARLADESSATVLRGIQRP